MWERDETGHGSLALFFHFSRLFTSYISLRDERREEMEEMGDLSGRTLEVLRAAPRFVYFRVFARHPHSTPLLVTYSRLTPSRVTRNRGAMEVRTEHRGDEEQRRRERHE